jgi:release factor glutamine methyltransferase
VSLPANTLDRRAAAEAVDDLLRRHHTITEPTVFELVGLEWDLLPGVYAPNLTRSAALYAEWVPYPIGGTFCEIGCGTGYIAVIAALRGCEHVTAIDISPQATRNTDLNASRHGVAGRVRALWWHMFPPPSGDSLYDVIFWNSNFVEGAGSENSDLGHALFDPGYESHAAFFRDAAKHLNPGGRLLLGFADLGDREKLAEVAGRYGWEPVIVRLAPSESPYGLIFFQLIEFTRRDVH